MPKIHLLLPQTLSLNESIALGLQYNPSLQAHFQELGIGKSDFVQAGFYSNPNVTSVFKIPDNNGNIRTDIEVSASFMLSDLWQVPLRKKVALRSLEIKTHEVMSNILDLRKNIQNTYLDCLYQTEYLRLVSEIAAAVEKIKKQVAYRYQFGYSTPLDNYFSLSKSAEWQAKLIDAQTALLTAHATFYQMLGLPPQCDEITLSDPITIPRTQLNDRLLQQFALRSHPYILIEQTKITKARAEMSYEQSRIIDNVQLGISYERGFDKGTVGVGPSFGIDIPLFNGNYGNIERARYEIKQAEKSLRSQQQMLFTNIHIECIRLNSYLNQIHHYEKVVIPSMEQAIKSSKELFDKMQMNMVVFIETQIELLTSKITLLDINYKAAQQYIELEFNVGAQLEKVIAPQEQYVHA